MNEYEALLRLQDIDLELIRLNKTLRDMPQQKRIAAIKRAKAKLASEASKVMGQRKDAQMDVDDSEAEQAHLLEVQAEVRQRAAQTTNHRELADFEAQLTSLAKKLEKNEYRYGGLVERLDTLQKAEANAQVMQGRLDRQLAQEREALERSSGDLMAHVRTLAGERKDVLADLTDDTKATYERSFRRFGGLAVERLQGNVPSVCRVALQPRQYADLHRRGPIHECPYCHRMLVTEEVAD